MADISNSTVGVKYDEGKLRYDLIPAYPMEQLAAVFTYGASKYADLNWMKGIPYRKLIGSLFRHIWAFVRGEDLDYESGLPNLSHALCNICMLLYFTKFRPDLDNRVKETDSGNMVRGRIRRASDSLGNSLQPQGFNCCKQDSPIRDQVAINQREQKSDCDDNRQTGQKLSSNSGYIRGRSTNSWYTEAWTGSNFSSSS